jgi:hypothetical protein
MSLPYHLGNGWVADFFLTPAVFALVAVNSDIYSVSGRMGGDRRRGDPALRAGDQRQKLPRLAVR